VINEIGAGIVAGRYPVGSVLPNDAEMMAQFNVSRTVLREALKTLESKGLVEARPKVGTKVATRSRWNHFDPQVLAWLYAAGLDTHTLEQITAIRLALEPQAAAQVAERRTADDIRLMQYWIRQMENSAHSPLNFAVADFELHTVVADASRNYFLRTFLGIVELSHTCLYRRWVETDTAVPREVLAAHVKLVKAIEMSDGAAASAATHASIELDHRLSAGQA
jgi:DNA-binding FadR family transcriptional regulator